MKYLSWDQRTISDFSDQSVSEMYEKGYLFTRLGKGAMQKTRSVRINLSKFELSSENRRILKKTEGLTSSERELPLRDYDFSLGKLAKDFYANKFGPAVMSAQKAKELLTDSEQSNFNLLIDCGGIGYAICFANKSILHYSYPFYDLQKSPKDMGLGMMIRAVEFAKAKNLKYVYLGSLQRPADTYKLQFAGLEWFDGEKWRIDLEEVKKLLRAATQEK